MKARNATAVILTFLSLLEAHGAPDVVDRDAVRDVGSLRMTVLQDWAPAKGDAEVRQKLVEITVCEWWPGQEVRIPVTFNAPADGSPCAHLILMNMGLAPRAPARLDPVGKALLERGVGVISVGIGTIDAMAPAGQLHLGMREQLLKTKDPRYSAPWIWGMSMMRAVTAALTEEAVFGGVMKIVATGGSKRGVASACAGIYDDRITGIVPVVAPPIGKPGGGFVAGLTPEAVRVANDAFFRDLKAGRLGLEPRVADGLAARAGRQAAARITVEEAHAAGWSREDVDRVVEEITSLSQVAAHRVALDRRGLAYFYNVGTNDNVSPGLLELGRDHPDFPIFILPGGQHGGPGMGFTKQVPKLRETSENLHAFCSNHFFGDRPMMRAPAVEVARTGNAIRVTATFAKKGPRPDASELWWTTGRHPAGSLPYEHDVWRSAPMEEEKKKTKGVWVATIEVGEGVAAVDLVTVHHDEMNGLPAHVSGPWVRVDE